VDVHVLETAAGVTLDDSALLASSGGLLVTGDVALVGDSDLALGPLGLNATGDLSLDGTSHVEQGVGAMELGGDVTLEGTSVLTMGSGPMTVTQDVVINSGAKITSAEIEEDFDSQVVISCESMWISEGATIDVTSKGYPQGYWWGWQDAGLGTKVGGSHGGQGSLGNQTNESTNPVYGNLYDPDTPGAGGGYNGRGGGVVRLDVADTLTVQGTILAQGFQGSGNGAGGSVSLRANIITGDGEISVMGGSVISNGYGTGSGGRVALLDYGLLAGAFSLDALGGDDFGVNVRAGSSYGCYAGSSGTLYLHPAGAVYGSLLVDNGADGCVLHSQPGAGREYAYRQHLLHGRE
jgi:hypothetical protein